MIKNPDLFAAFSADWHLHAYHPWHARWARRDRFWALGLQHMGRHRQVMTRLFWGQPMRVVTGEVVSRGLLAFGYSEPDLTAILCELLPPGGTAVDIGTHFGYEAMLMAELVGPEGQIHAFEPNPEVRAITSLNLAVYPPITLHPCALGAAAGKAVFHFPPLAMSAFGGYTGDSFKNTTAGEVQVMRLDDVPIATAVSFIKCDAEGAEDAILSGSTRVLANHPVLVLETGMTDGDKPSPDLAVIDRRLAPLGYRPFAFRFDGALHVSPAGAFPTGHANTLFLHETHARFANFQQGWSRRV